MDYFEHPLEYIKPSALSIFYPRYFLLKKALKGSRQKETYDIFLVVPSVRNIHIYFLKLSLNMMSNHYTITLLFWRLHLWLIAIAKVSY